MSKSKPWQTRSYMNGIVLLFFFYVFFFFFKNWIVDHSKENSNMTTFRKLCWVFKLRCLKLLLEEISWTHQNLIRLTHETYILRMSWRMQTLLVWWVQCLCFIGCSLAPSVGAVWVSADQQWHMTALISITNSEDNLNIWVKAGLFQTLPVLSRLKADLVHSWSEAIPGY